MSETLQTTDVAASDADLLGQTAIAVRAAGSALRERFGEVVRYQTREELMRALAANDDTALDILRPRLTRLRPDAGWVEDELDGGALPPGEWWVVDPAEGNVNHLHALPEWAVTATLVRENQPVLTAVHLPLTGETYTALTGAGAHLCARDPASAERGRRPDRRLLAVRRRPRGSASRGAARHRGRRTDLRRRGPPLDPAEREPPGHRARRPRRGRRHALTLTAHHNLHA